MLRLKSSKWPVLSAAKQRGQAIVYIVAMLPAIFLSILVIYNTATLTREKMSLQNTADATTYSAGVVVARNLNYLSYTNRAMAANEAGIATVASMQSGVASMLTTVANLFEAQALVYSLKAMTEFLQIWEPIVGLAHIAPWEAASQSAQSADRIARTVGNLQSVAAYPFRIMADALRILNYGISAAQAAMYASTIAAIPTTVTDVMEKNDPNAKLPVADSLINLSLFALQYATYIRPYWQKIGPGSDKEKFDEAKRFAHTAQAMRDDWTKSRRLLPGLFGKANFMGSIMKFFFTKVIEFKGGSELVSDLHPFDGTQQGRIRWQSADAVYVDAPIDWLLGSLPIPQRAIDWEDTLLFRFGIGAGAAAQGGPNRLSSWSGSQVVLPAAGTVARTYGGLDDKNADGTEGIMTRSAFERAAESDDRQLLATTPEAIFAEVFDPKWRFGPLQEIGLLTSDTYMPPYWDVTTHPQMREYESDNFMGQQVISGKNPLKWGSKSDRGPVITLSMEKSADKIKTGEQAKIGYAPGKIGLKDNMVKNKIKVLSSTQIYFRRPQDRWTRRDLGKDNAPKVGFTGGYIEHRSLFSPYWHVHNVQPSLWARAVALGTNLIGSSSQPDWANGQSD